MSRSRRAAVAAAFAVAATFVGPWSALPAHAASCSGNACNNLDPHDTGCDKDAKDLDDKTHNLVRFVLRYSASCDAAWVRYSFTGGRGTGGDVIAIQKLVKPPYKDAYWMDASTTGDQISHNSTGWTKMVSGSASNTVQVRGFIYPNVGTAATAHTDPHPI